MRRTLLAPLVWAVAFAGLGVRADAQVVPGTGLKVNEVGDDFEDENWTYTPNLPKASGNIDKVERYPTGFSSNNRWLESTYRGTPDSIRRVAPPKGGVPGSQGAMAIRTLHSGVPGSVSNKFQQDDLIANFAMTIGALPVNRSPSVVTRVYIPPFEQWEQRSGSHFGFRADCMTMIDEKNKVLSIFRGGSKKPEAYWPGFFVQLQRKQDGFPETQAMLLLRSGTRGEDIPGPVITTPGWWTLGMSFTPDGQVHYYAHEGVSKLTAKDHLLSVYPYGYKAMQLSTMFYNVVNQDDGRTWSTEWIVDDAEVFVLH